MSVSLKRSVLEVGEDLLRIAGTALLPSERVRSTCSWLERSALERGGPILLRPGRSYISLNIILFSKAAAEEEHPLEKVGARVWPCGDGEVMLTLVIRSLLQGDAAAATNAADPAADLGFCE